MHSETRRILDVIEGALIKGHAASSAPGNFTTDPADYRVATELWNILSALRGPDTPNAEGTAKERTVVIRRAAFPALAGIIDMRRSELARTSANFANLPTFVTGVAHITPSYKEVRAGVHFDNHIHTATLSINSK